MKVYMLIFYYGDQDSNDVNGFCFSTREKAIEDMKRQYEYELNTLKHRGIETTKEGISTYKNSVNYAVIETKEEYNKWLIVETKVI